MEHIINPVYYQDFILAGNAEFTLKSVKTGSEQIFVVKKMAPANGYWVNNRLREWIGKLTIENSIEDIWVFSQRVSDMTLLQADQMRIFAWFWHNWMLGLLNPKLQQIQVINHTNRCSHCHRPLTHPESIPIGIGPDCFKKLGLEHKQLITLP